MNRLWLFAFLAAALAGAGCARTQKVATPSQAARDYYPLALGNRWIYETKMLGETGTRTVEITGERDGFYLDSLGGQLMADAYGVRDQKRYLLRDPLQKDSVWTNVVSVSSVERYQISDAGFACDVPAGHFDNCVRVEGRNRVDPKTTLVNEVTFAPGVGIVSVEVFAEVEKKRIPQTKLVLKEFHLSAAGAQR